jgi:hypothetical protein
LGARFRIALPVRVPAKQPINPVLAQLVDDAETVSRQLQALAQELAFELDPAGKQFEQFVATTRRVSAFLKSVLTAQNTEIPEQFDEVFQATFSQLQKAQTLIDELAGRFRLEVEQGAYFFPNFHALFPNIPGHRRSAESADHDESRARAYASKLARVPKQSGIGWRCSVENQEG